MKSLKTFPIIVMLAALLSCTMPLVWGEEPALPTSPAPPGDLGPAHTLTGVPTHTKTPEETPGPAPLPTQLPTVARSPVPVLTPAASPSPEPLLYGVQTGSPAAVPNFAHPEFGCNWLGLGGQVFGFAGKPEIGKILEVGGQLAGVETNLLSVTGGTTIYGEGGYEFTLSQQPLRSSKTLWVQLFDIDGTPLSEKIFFDTYSECDRNLILVNFVGLTPGRFDSFFPFIIRN